jgi:adenylosuccinate lyase
MEVFPQNMLNKMDKTHGCIYSGHVKNLLLQWGIDPETVYRLVQEKSFRVIQEGRHDLFSLLIEDELIKKHISDSEKSAELKDCFDPWRGLKNINEIFNRFGL